MDALLSAFVAAALAEWGDRTQLFVIVLAARYCRPGPILAGLALAALANSLLAAIGGTFVHDLIETRALALLVALALLFAGFGSLLRRTPPDMGAGWRTPAFITAAICLFLLEFGDKTQFLTFALAGRFDSVALAAAGATLGVMAANVPAALLGARFADTVPIRPIRYAIAALFLVAGFIVAVGALELT
ncbi:TMEM165/GDT1 family protein [Allosphingosinicella sp.]|jgi:putative Ca2+/H+ antiporter (TMEM165/GDT1 family)|uniref:TMEM165/GDT1 family protein n=1 Tax=Allosphingosinicella sp. TaxID=2823234 RepID=UPI002F11670B